jgi:nicotinamidase-related amidase
MYGKKALLLIDFVNDLVKSNGRLASKGYPEFIDVHNTIGNLSTVLQKARKAGILIIHVKVSFSYDYKEQPKNSPLFGAADKIGTFRSSDSGDEFIEAARPLENEKVIIKNRVSSFYGTSLDLLLRNAGIEELFVCGISTDLGVQSAVKDAHDRDYRVSVIGECCAAPNEDDHIQSLRMMKKVANVIKIEDIKF